MMRALWSAASGMKGQQTNMDVIANNIANVNTYGGKKVRQNSRIWSIRHCVMLVRRAVRTLSFQRGCRLVSERKWRRQTVS